MDRNTPSLATQEVGYASAPAGVALPANPSRRLLVVHNPGATAWKFRFGSAPDGTNGITVGAMSSMVFDTRVPTGDLYVASGVACYILHG